MGGIFSRTDSSSFEISVFRLVIQTTTPSSQFPRPELQPLPKLKPDRVFVRRPSVHGAEGTGLGARRLGVVPIDF